MRRRWKHLLGQKAPVNGIVYHAVNRLSHVRALSVPSCILRLHACFSAGAQRETPPPGDSTAGFFNWSRELRPPWLGPFLLHHLGRNWIATSTLDSDARLSLATGHLRVRDSLFPLGTRLGPLAP